MPTRRTAPWKTLAFAALAAVFLQACSSNEELDYEDQPVDAIYNTAMETLLDRNYESAAKQFEEVERQHPYSIWAAKAQVMSAYAYFRRDMYNEAINAADRFIQLHPTSPDAPYAYYLKSLAYYEQIVDVGRDQRTTTQALESLEDVVRRFPETQYARDASLKLDLTRDHLAGKEMAVGRYYLKRGELTASINRFKRVIEQHQTTSHVPEALLRLSEAYTALGLTNEARRMTAILGHNYPGNPWYADAYELVENVEVANFPREDDRAFYDRWLDPDATIARAERRDVPELAAGFTSPVDALASANAANQAPAQPGRSVARISIDEPSPPAPASEDEIAEAVAQDRAENAATSVKVEADDDEDSGGFFGAIGRVADSVISLPGELLDGDEAPPVQDPAVVAQAPSQAAPELQPELNTDVAEQAAPVADAPTQTDPQPAQLAAQARRLAESQVRNQPQNRARQASSAAARRQPTQSERIAAVAEAESQMLAAREAAGEWRRAAAAASSEASRTRADANVVLSEAAAEYWAARGAVAAAQTDEAVRTSELALAQKSVTFWAAAHDAAEDDLARQHASQNLAQAEQVLDYWQKNGERPGWLRRTFGSAI